MAKPDQYTTSADLQNVAYGGMVLEDVMNEIWDISSVPLPFTDAVGSDTVKNSYTEWTTDKLGDPTVGGWVVDGSDSDKNDSAQGARIGNHCGILTKEVQVSTRAGEVDTIGGDQLARQIMMRQKELRRNVEANLLGIQGSQADDGNTTPGVPAGLAAMVTKFGSGTSGTGGVFSNGSWSAWTPGTAQGLTETDIRDACQAAWEDGADPSLLMSVPSVIRKLSEYMFTSSARIATLTKDTQGEDGAAKALGAVNVFLTDFGVTLEFVPNRIQQTYADATPVTAKQAASVFILDPAYARVGMLHGYRVEPLAKTGLSEKRLMAVDFTLKVLNLDAHRVIPDIDPTAVVTA